MKSSNMEKSNEATHEMLWIDKDSPITFYSWEPIESGFLAMTDPVNGDLQNPIIVMRDPSISEEEKKDFIKRFGREK